MNDRKLKSIRTKLASLGNKPHEKAKRDIRTTIVLSGSEKERLDRESHAAGLRQSDWMRWKMFGDNDAVKLTQTDSSHSISEVNRELIVELRRAGTNVNQQTRAINTFDSSINTDQNLAVLSELKALLIKIEASLYD